MTDEFVKEGEKADTPIVAPTRAFSGRNCVHGEAGPRYSEWSN
jgi:hypothetical protein